MAALLVLTATALPAPRDIDDADTASEHGVKLANKNDLRGALGYFRQAVRLDSNNPSRWNDLGVTFMRSDMVQKAAKAFVHALSLSPSDDGAMSNLVEVLKYAKKRVDWKPLLERAELVELISSVDSKLGNAPKRPARKAANREQVRKEGDEDWRTFGPGGPKPDAPPPKSLGVNVADLPVRIRHTANPLPTFSWPELSKPENRDYKEGRKPFVLQGLIPQWEGYDDPETWSADYFASRFGKEAVDFYPRNLFRVQDKPYITTLKAAVKRIKKIASKGKGAYIQWNVREPIWRQVYGEFGPHPHLYRTDNAWIDGCMPNNTNDFANEFVISQHWRMVLIGSRGAGMFNHIDTLRTASYQFQLRGRKRWHLCSPSESDILHSVAGGSVDMFRPSDEDYENFPELLDLQECWTGVVQAGQVVYYPMDYWHQTENLDDFTISASSTLVDLHNWAQVAEQLEANCDRPDKMDMIQASDDLCERLSYCFKWWRTAFGTYESALRTDPTEANHTATGSTDTIGHFSADAEAAVCPRGGAQALAGEMLASGRSRALQDHRRNGGM